MSEINILGKIDFVDCRDLTMRKTEGGFISLTINGKEYERVNFYRAFPLSKPDEYISVRDNDKNEICLIRNINELSQEYAQLVKMDLDRRYFTPEIIKINTVKDEYGYVYMNMLTDSGERSVTIPNGSSNFIRLSDVRLILIDIDGNRFGIEDYLKLDEKSVRLLETLI